MKREDTFVQQTIQEEEKNGRRKRIKEESI